MISHTSEGDTYKCNQCNESFLTEMHLCTHMIKHSNRKAYQSCKSNFSPTKDSDLKMHSMPHTTEETQINQDPKSYPACSDLKSSTAVHMDKNPYQCNQCDSSFSNDVDLICHMSLHTIEKKYQCIQCDESFATKISLDQHIIIHTDNNINQCSSLANLNLDNSNHNNQIKIHTSEEKLQSNQCNKISSKEIELKTHFSTHTGEEKQDSRFCCSECDYTCEQKYNLKKHLVTHKILLCAVCDFSCKGKGNMRVHMKDHLEGITLSCNVCGTGFNSNSDLERHMIEDCGKTETNLSGLEHSVKVKTKMSERKARTDRIVPQSVIRNKQPIINILNDSETEFSNCEGEINCLHCIKLLRIKHHRQITEQNFDSDLLKNNPLIINCGKKHVHRTGKKTALDKLKMMKVLLLT